VVSSEGAKTVKAITLYEPWAALVAAGWKEVETRDWYTGYRGLLAIHASVHPADKREISRLTFLLGSKGHALPEFQMGRVVAVCRLAACVPTALVDVRSMQIKPQFFPVHGWDVERAVGNYDNGRWAWILRDVQRLETPVFVRGQRKLWDWTPPEGTVLPSVSTDPAISSPASKVVV
jgi:hypothetical protein